MAYFCLIKQIWGFLNITSVFNMLNAGQYTANVSIGGFVHNEIQYSIALNSDRTRAPDSQSHLSSCQCLVTQSENKWRFTRCIRSVLLLLKVNMCVIPLDRLSKQLSSCLDRKCKYFLTFS